jgi:hypothetical protein
LCTRAPRLTENRKRRRERCSQCARLDQESPPNNKKGLVASLTKTHQRASYGLAPSFQARFTSISRLVARKPLARYGATQGRARSRLAPPATLQISQWSWGGVSSSCRRGINSGCRLTLQPHRLQGVIQNRGQIGLDYFEFSGEHGNDLLLPCAMVLASVHRLAPGNRYL